ncbi:MAG: hypothetical protein E7054_06025 [Lentisphaerae bacterium]|nr:hypothetical protein [Lentisphaerota bacterium]
MLCKYCHYEFYVSADSLGSKVRCPNCTGTVNVVDKQIICPCPECGGMLDISIWMLGSSSSCPHCQKSIILSLGEDSAKYLPESPKHTEMLKTATHKAGDIIGKYRVIRCLGIGGMGEVYLVEHTLLNHRCALKLLKNGIAKDDPEMRARLLREARLASQIQHKNLIAVLDAELDEKTATGYIVMEYIDGVSIEQILVDGPMLEERALEIISEVAEALKVASEHKITHRDIKPANIMLSRTGEIKVADLGIAKVESDGRQNMTLTMDNAVLGTPYYASPEQLRSSHQVDCRADIYSLGATLYHMLTGKRPFEAESLLGVMCNVLEKDLPMAHTVNPEISLKTSELISRMMAKKREDRPDDFGKLLDELNSGRKVGFTALLRKKLKAVFSFKYVWFAVFALLLVCGAWLTAKAVYGNKKTAESEVKIVKVIEKVPAAPPVVLKPEPKPKSKSRTQVAIEDEVFQFSSDRKTLIKCINKKIIEAVIPPGVTTIGDRAFYDCNSLTGITIPDSVTTISDMAFDGCEKLTSVTLPDSVTTIGIGAFSDCRSLTSITISRHLRSQRDIRNRWDLPKGCKIKTAGESDDFTLNDDGEILIKCANRSVKKAVIPLGVTIIENEAFADCQSLISVTIPDSVTTIRDRAFFGCSRLTSITLPNSVTTIGDYAFRGCEKLTSITIPNSVTTIGYYAFSGCDSLTSITIPRHLKSQSYRWSLPKGCKIKIAGEKNDDTNDSISFKTTNFTLSGDGKVLIKCTDKKIIEAVIPPGVTTIGDRAFDGCEKLTSVTLPDSVTTIGNFAFAHCRGLASVTIPDSVTTIGDSAFSLCLSLTSITIPNSVTKIGNFAFAGCNSLTGITIPDSVTTIGDSAFRDCEKLTSIMIPDSVTTISDMAFDGCEKLTSVTLPDRITTIGKEAFNGCEKLTSITIPDSVTTISGRAFADCLSLTSITIPNSVTTIGDSAFSHCRRLTSVTIPNSVTTIGNGAFAGIDKVTLVPENRFYKNDSYGAIITKDNKKLIYVPQNIKSYQIPSGVTTIGDYAFDFCYNMTSVTIPNSVTMIGDRAFSGCRSLTSVTIPNSVTTISVGAFSPCDSLTSVTIPSSVTTIENFAFSGCRSLTSVTIPNSVTTISGSAFSGCIRLTSITIPNSVTKIGDYAFSGCSSLTSVTIPDSVTTIGGSTFYSCQSLERVTIPAHLKSQSSKWSLPKGCKIKIAGEKSDDTDDSTSFNTTKQVGDFTLSGDGKVLIECRNKKIRKAVIPRGVKIIKDSAFKNCSSMTQLTLPAGLLEIRRNAFFNCSALKQLHIPDSVTDIGGGVFVFCRQLKVNIPAGVTNIGGGAFTSAKQVTLDKGNRHYKTDSYGAIVRNDNTELIFVPRNIRYYEIPRGVKVVHLDAFYGCTNLTEVKIPDTVQKINNYVFYGCVRLKKIQIPASVDFIGAGAFSYCFGLSRVTIPDSVQKIGLEAFYKCDNLKYLSLPAHLRNRKAELAIPYQVKVVFR